MSSSEAFSPKEAGSIKRYDYHSIAETSEALSAVGYGPTKKWVDAMYTSEDPENPIGVGVLRVTPERTRDHFDVLRGVDQVESIGQALVLLFQLQGKIPPNHKPLFAAIESTTFSEPAISAPDLNTDINIVVVPTGSDKRKFTAHGWVICGETVLTEANIAGAIVSDKLYERILQNARKRQLESTPLFPFQG